MKNHCDLSQAEIVSPVLYPVITASSPVLKRNRPHVACITVYYFLFQVKTPEVTKPSLEVMQFIIIEKDLDKEMCILNKHVIIPQAIGLLKQKTKQKSISEKSLHGVHRPLCPISKMMGPSMLALCLGKRKKIKIPSS